MQAYRSVRPAVSVSGLQILWFVLHRHPCGVYMLSSGCQSLKPHRWRCNPMDNRILPRRWVVGSHRHIELRWQPQCCICSYPSCLCSWDSQYLLSDTDFLLLHSGRDSCSIHHHLTFWWPRHPPPCWLELIQVFWPLAHVQVCRELAVPVPLSCQFLGGHR